MDSWSALVYGGRVRGSVALSCGDSAVAGLLQQPSGSLTRALDTASGGECDLERYNRGRDGLHRTDFRDRARRRIRYTGVPAVRYPCRGALLHRVTPAPGARPPQHVECARHTRAITNLP